MNITSFPSPIPTNITGNHSLLRILQAASPFSYEYYRKPLPFPMNITSNPSLPNTHIIYIYSLLSFQSTLSTYRIEAANCPVLCSHEHVVDSHSHEAHHKSCHQHRQNQWKHLFAIQDTTTVHNTSSSNNNNNNNSSGWHNEYNRAFDKNQVEYILCLSEKTTSE